MREKEWVDYIAQRLNESFSNKPELLIETQKKIPYAFKYYPMEMTGSP
jgi:hypothetical protein